MVFKSTGLMFVFLEKFLQDWEFGKLRPWAASSSSWIWREKIMLGTSRCKKRMGWQTGSTHWMWCHHHHHCHTRSIDIQAWAMLAKMWGLWRFLNQKVLAQLNRTSLWTKRKHVVILLYITLNWRMWSDEDGDVFYRSKLRLKFSIPTSGVLESVLRFLKRMFETSKLKLNFLVDVFLSFILCFFFFLSWAIIKTAESAVPTWM